MWLTAVGLICIGMQIFTVYRILDEWERAHWHPVLYFITLALQVLTFVLWSIALRRVYQLLQEKKGR